MKILALIKKVFIKHNNKNYTLTPKSEALFEDLKTNVIAIDCGANIGLVTERMAKKGGWHRN